VGKVHTFLVHEFIPSLDSADIVARIRRGVPVYVETPIKSLKVGDVVRLLVYDTVGSEKYALGEVTSGDDNLDVLFNGGISPKALRLKMFEHRKV